MSGIIPTISQPEETPYCIWYPEVLEEDTLRALAQRYPDKLYEAARACAVAGYIDLYKELDPLLEVHVAEETGYTSMQKSSNSSEQIYHHLLSQPVKFEIMNNYTRTVNIARRQVASLTGDTVAYSSLTARSKYYGPGEIESKHKPWVYLAKIPITSISLKTAEWMTMTARVAELVMSILLCFSAMPSRERLGRKKWKMKYHCRPLLRKFGNY